MSRSTPLLCVFALAACGDNLKPETSQDAGPPEDAVPDAGPTPPEAGGEYVVKVSPLSFICYDEPRLANTFYTLADVVPQANPWKFDLLSTGLQSTFVYYTSYNTSWNQEEDGNFSDAHVNDVSFGPGVTVEAKRFIDGVASGYDLGFHHSYDLGMDLEDDSWYSFCVYEADISGPRRYTPWNNASRTTIDGQWWVKKTVLESPLNYPNSFNKRTETANKLTDALSKMATKPKDSLLDPTVVEESELVPNEIKIDGRLLPNTTDPVFTANLPYIHFVKMDTLTGTANETVFELTGGFNGLWGVLRNPTTGAVDALAIEIVPSGTETVVYETKLWGTLLPDVMDLQFSWKWYIQETGAVQWFQHEHYEGVPRYNPHNNALIEPPQGAYNAEYKLVENDCDLAAYTQHRLLDVWLMDDGAVWPKITDFGIEPETQLGPNGELNIAFSRYSNGEFYNYSFVDSTITGHAVDLNMTVDVINTSGLPVCTAKYEITGPKRYESYR